ncbi:MAG: hypothetical protein AB7O62_09505 [Pirellulales bacterium]
MADLPFLERRYDAPHFLKLAGTQYEVCLDVDFGNARKAELLANAAADDIPAIEAFFQRRLKMLVVCDASRANFHEWPMIQFS